MHLQDMKVSQCVCMCMWGLVTPTLGKQGQDCCEFKTSLFHMASSTIARAT